jgi:hypothetical protein
MRPLRYGNLTRNLDKKVQMPGRALTAGGQEGIRSPEILFEPNGFRHRWDKTGIKSCAISRFKRKRNLCNSKAAFGLVAEEEGFEPPRPFRV